LAIHDHDNSSERAKANSYEKEKLLSFNPLSPELNPICYLLALLAHDFLHVSRIRVKSLSLTLLMSYIYDISNLRVNILSTWQWLNPSAIGRGYIKVEMSSGKNM
jgi:transposase